MFLVLFEQKKEVILRKGKKKSYRNKAHRKIKILESSLVCKHFKFVTTTTVTTKIRTKSYVSQ